VLWRRRKKKQQPATDTGEELVPIANLNALEAQLVAGRLREAGIEAAVFTNDSGGTQPELGYAEGSTVMVRRRDADAAAEVVRDVPP